MRKFIAISAIVAMTTVGFASDADIRAELEELKKEIQALKEAQAKINIKSLKRQISSLKAKTGGDNLKWNVDFRTAYDVIGYKTVKGNSNWNQILTNRLWLGMAYAPKDNIVFKGLISYYKEYGQLPAPKQGFNYFDWVVNETPNPSGELRVKEAYWLYFGEDFLGADIPWTASIGRRPATDGLLVSYREDQKPKSPLGHIINTEFDGGSFKFDLEKIADISGMYFKICLGRGMSNSAIRFNGITQIGDGKYKLEGDGSEYNKVDGWKSIDLAGFIFVPYDDGQYSIHTTAFKAFNLPGMVLTKLIDQDGSLSTQNDQSPSEFTFMQTGDYYGAAISFLAQGIGDGISDILDDTNAFISFAWSKTDPNKNSYEIEIVDVNNSLIVPISSELGMLGTSNKKSGTSIYLGLNWPCQLIDDARVGIEYNHGSKYWRSFTYAEDTLAGSKLATRGDAYEVWFTKELIGKTLTAQIRYTYIDYKYTGSNGFFGDAGAPKSVDSYKNMPSGYDTVDTAQDLRFYIRYRY